MSLYLGEQKIADNTCSRNIGEIVASTIPLTDAGLHLLDGALISSAGSYAKFVTYIAGLVSNYPDLFETEANWQTAVTTYGVCSKFVYDSTNNTVRLPKITGFTEGTTDVTALGDLVEAGLPNITGELKTYVDLGRSEGTGAIRRQNDGKKYVGTNTITSGTQYDGFDFDASRSNSIYGNSSTVQPQSIKVLYYIVIATSTKTNIEVDIDEIATDLNGKVDVDLSNVNASGTSLASGWSMPSSRYIDLTLGASGTTYTAPANGYISIVMAGTVSGNTGYFSQLYDNGVEIRRFGDQSSSGAYHVFTLNFEIGKGQTFTLSYYGLSPNFFRFIYAEGEN